MPIWPDQNERSYLDFAIGKGGFGLRYLVAAVLFVLGFWLLLAGACFPVGLLLVLLGHLPLWVRRQRLAPAPTDPLEEPVWAPVDGDWHTRIEELVRSGRRWDQSFWDASSPLVLVTFGVLGAIGFLLFSTLAITTDELAWLPFMAGLVALWGPLFVNGMRAPWHPNQLVLEGRALAPVADMVEQAAPGAYDVVPLLGLREGGRGRYPEHARVMLRPKADDGSGFIGVQVQVCLNNVRGTNYPYLYCVVLGKTGFYFPAISTDLVTEAGEGQDVRYMVVRQYADRNGGWHTDEAAVALIVTSALELAAKARLTNAR